MELNRRCLLGEVKGLSMLLDSGEPYADLEHDAQMAMMHDELVYD